MQRFIMEKLVKWKNDKNRKPLILKGARQVGKTYILKEYKAPSSIILMTAALVEKKEDGILSLRLNNKNYSLKFNPNQLSAMIEEVEHNDASIKNMWGKVYRIKLQINSQELHNRVTYSLSEIPNNKI